MRSKILYILLASHKERGFFCLPSDKSVAYFGVKYLTLGLEVSAFTVSSLHAVSNAYSAEVQTVCYRLSGETRCSNNQALLGMTNP